MKSIEEITNKPVTRVAFIIDKSSSMFRSTNFVLSTFNDQLKEMISKSDENDVEVSVVFFANNVDELQFNVPLSECKEIGERDYKPHGCTALNDAIGLTIDRYLELQENDHVMTDDVSYLFIIITDGYENASRKFSKEDISSRIKELEATNRWTFTYFGEDVNVEKIKTSYGFAASNVVASTLDSAAPTVTRGVSNFLRGRARGQTMSTSFYAEPGLTEENEDANLELEKKLIVKANK